MLFCERFPILLPYSLSIAKTPQTHIYKEATFTFGLSSKQVVETFAMRGKHCSQRPCTENLILRTSVQKKPYSGVVHRLMPIIPDTQGAALGRIQVPSEPMGKGDETSSQPTSWV
jgi:hypothetical protein